MRDKIYNFLNKNLKDFNLTVIVICSIVFLSLVGLISYKLSSSYALFTDTVEGKKTITLHYEKKYDNFTDYLKAKANKNQTIDFSKAPSDTNGNGVNILEGTENDEFPIYFYRGFDTEGKDVVDYNNVLFGGFCWKIVRTTDTGGIKIVYNGAPTQDGKCTSSFSDSGRSASTSNVAMPSSSTYYYGTEYTFDEATGQYSLSGTKTDGVWSSDFIGKYTCKNRMVTGTCTTLYYLDAYISATQAKAYSYTTISNAQLSATSIFNPHSDSLAYNGYMYGTVYAYNNGAATSGSLFGSSFTYSGGSYILTDAQSTKDNTHHYSCNNSSGTCSTIRYYYYKNYYIELTGGDGVEEALTKMQTNTTDSTIKMVIDNWYEANLADYESYLEDTVWCNDRSMNTQTNGWKENGSLTEEMNYASYGRNRQTYIPSTNCTNKNDAFTVNDLAKGNGALDYPIALLTADELTMSGSGFSGYSTKSYLYTYQKYWSLSPYNFNTYAYEFVLNSSGKLNYSVSNGSMGVRPAVSLKPGTNFSSGDGSANSPYKVK